MTERDWLDLSGPEDLYGELAAVVQPRKLFQLGAAFLTPILDSLPGDSSRAAVLATRAYVAGRADAREILEAWSRAERASGDGLWANGPEVDYRRWGCPCCEGMDGDPLPEREGILDDCREAIRDPAWFAARAAWLALEVGTHDIRADKRPAARRALQASQRKVYVDLVGDPLAPPRREPVPLDRHPALDRLLAAIEGQQTIEPLLLLALADALEEGGCCDQGLLSHLRSGGPHFAGCWAVERAAGRETIELPVDDAVLWPLARYERRWWGW